MMERMLGVSPAAANRPKVIFQLAGAAIFFAAVFKGAFEVEYIGSGVRPLR